jgi:hypothetical protein
MCKATLDIAVSKLLSGKGGGTAMSATRNLTLEPNWSRARSMASADRSIAVTHSLREPGLQRRSRIRTPVQEWCVLLPAGAGPGTARSTALRSRHRHRLRADRGHALLTRPVTRRSSGPNRWAQVLSGRKMITVVPPAPLPPPPQLPQADIDRRGPRETIQLPPYSTGS